MLPGAGRVQVDESSAAGGVAHAFHQLARVGPCLSHELVTRMAQIVQVDIETGRDERGTPGTAAEVGVPQRPTGERHQGEIVAERILAPGEPGGEYPTE